MSEIKEYIGCESIQGNNLCNMWLTDEEIIRCRDCGKSREKGWKCARFSEEQFDAEQEIGELVMANVRPDDHCAWAERREIA